MAQVNVSLDAKKKVLTITLPIEESISASGKSKVIASTRGNLVTSVMYEGKPLTIGVNAYIKN